jgi:hypothetical protein
MTKLDTRTKKNVGGSSTSATSSLVYLYVNEVSYRGHLFALTAKALVQVFGSGGEIDDILSLLEVLTCLLCENN